MNKYLKQFALFIFLSFVFTPSTYAKDTLKMLIWEGYAPPEQVEIFKNIIQKKYNKPINIEISHEVSGVEDFFDALRGHKAHIISPSHNIIKDERFGFIKHNLITPINLANVPNYKNIIQPLQNIDYATDIHGQVYGIPLAHGPYGLAYNTKFFKNPPTSWNILWEKQFINKYAISNDYWEVNIYITALSEGYSGKNIYNFNKFRSNKKFRDKLSLLVKNAKVFWKGVDTADDIEGLALATTWGFCLDDLSKRGEVWKMAEPQEGTTGWVDNFVLSSDLSDKPFLKTVAEEWLNFILNPEFQANVVVRQLESDPVVTTVRDLLTKDEVAKHHLDEPNYFQNKRILWPILDEKNYERSALHNLWKHTTKKRESLP